MLTAAVKSFKEKERANHIMMTESENNNIKPIGHTR